MIDDTLVLTLCRIRSAKTILNKQNMTSGLNKHKAKNSLIIV